MLNVGALHEGFVLDHIKAGKAMTIYHDLISWTAPLRLSKMPKVIKWALKISSK